MSMIFGGIGKKLAIIAINGVEGDGMERERLARGRDR